jgi:hypothetical protein
VCVERVDQHAEGEVALELRRRAVEDDESASFSLPPQFGKQERLSDPRLSLDHDVRRGALLEVVKRLPEEPNLGLTPDDLFGC